MSLFKALSGFEILFAGFWCCVKDMRVGSVGRKVQTAVEYRALCSGLVGAGGWGFTCCLSEVGV